MGRELGQGGTKMPTTRQYGFLAFALAVVLWVWTTQGRAPEDERARALASPAAVAIFDRADRDADGVLSKTEFAAASIEVSRKRTAAAVLPLVPTSPIAAAEAVQVPSSTGQTTATTTASPFTAAAAAAAAVPHGGAAQPLPQCSILFFYHIVKTAGTTMRTVLQRQAQLGDFEYVYTDTTRKPRWQLLMHQLTHPVAHRRIIIELHSEWGLPRAFFADVRRLRGLYEKLGCTVTLATVLRHPLNFYLSWFNWRASNYMPLCLWDPPRDPQSRQLLGWGLPFVTARQPAAMGGRELHLPLASVLSVLRHFDVVGLTERFDESLLLLGSRVGFRSLGYARLAENLKPDHPKAAKRVLHAMLSDAGVPRGLNSSFAFSPAGSGMFAPVADAVEGGVGGGGGGGGGAKRPWSDATLSAMSALGAISMDFVLKKNARRPQGPEKADCNFYPCAGALSQARGMVTAGLCGTDGRGGNGGDPKEMLTQMLEKTQTDRDVHGVVVRQLEAAIAAAERTAAASGAPSVAAQLAALRTQSDDVQRRRTEQIGARREKLCGVRLCGTPLRSCVGCEPNPVPGLEPCWPSWEDQFSPDERKVWCRRQMTIPGYDALEIQMRTYPKVPRIPCWRTCWEAMTQNASHAHSTNPTCLQRDAPAPSEGSAAGPSCAKREVHCSPACTAPFPGSLKEYWEREWLRHPDRPNEEAIGIECPCGQGG
jgi:hypothetical protein